MSLARAGGVILGLLLAGADARGGDEPSLRSVIDRDIEAHLQRLGVSPAPLADDATFLRRVMLDLAGSIPAADEVERFLADADPAKRSKVVDRLLEDPRAAAHQAAQWDLALFGRSPASSEVRKRDSFQKWLTEQFAKNVPYDRWVLDLLMAEGNAADQGAPFFLVQFRGQPLETAEAVTRLFLGTQIRCARCHDHPSDKWTQKDFYGFAAFFARLVLVDGGGSEGKKKYMIAEKSSGDLMFTGPAKDQKPGQKGEPISAKYLDGAVVEEPPLPKDFKEPDLKNPKGPLAKPLFSRREKLAAWLVSPRNPFFAKAAVNRVWTQFLGRGFYNPVDDLKEDERATHPALLRALQDDLVARKFDLKLFIREIVNSRTYQRASAGAPGEAQGGYEKFHLRPLSAEEMMAALRTASGADAPSGDGKAAAVSSSLSEYFVRYMGNVTDGRGEFQGSVSERLFMNNSGQIRQLLQRRKGNLADQILSSADPWEARIDRMFLSVLGRLPRAPEREKFVAHLKGAAKPEPAVEEAIWVLVNCGEFRFNH
ncbi:MAG: DUF1549 domain-containing protein [Planctomycetes bacterium]|nr:DUF1549 domain-containing protein [Planctomycetota bacterium]